MPSPLRKAAQALWDAIDQEYDVDDGIANFSEDIGLAYTNLGLVLKPYKEPTEQLRLWLLWHDAFTQGKADAECEPCDLVETLRSLLAKVEASHA